MVYRIFVEKKPGLDQEARSLLNDARTFLGISSLERVRLLNRYDLEDIPEEYRPAGSQSCCRLHNGNTILCSRGGGGKTPQVIEVTPEHEIAWVLKDWKHLGPCTALQILDEPGIPEQPGACFR